MKIMLRNDTITTMPTVDELKYELRRLASNSRIDGKKDVLTARLDRFKSGTALSGNRKARKGPTVADLKAELANYGSNVNLTGKKNALTARAERLRAGKPASGNRKARKGPTVANLKAELKRYGSNVNLKGLKANLTARLENYQSGRHTREAPPPRKTVPDIKADLAGYGSNVNLRGNKAMLTARLERLQSGAPLSGNRRRAKSPTVADLQARLRAFSANLGRRVRVGGSKKEVKARVERLTAGRPGSNNLL